MRVYVGLVQIPASASFGNLFLKGYYGSAATQVAAPIFDKLAKSHDRFYPRYILYIEDRQLYI